MLTGTGTAGAYHAGVLRALHEAGVKIDLVAGRGIGRIGAMFAAVDGGARLWDANGAVAPAGGARRSTLAAAAARRRLGAVAAAGVVLAVPLALLARGRGRSASSGMLLTLVGLERPATAANARPTAAGSKRCSRRRRCRPSFRGSSCSACSSRARALAAGVVLVGLLERAARAPHPATGSSGGSLGAPLSPTTLVRRAAAPSCGT